MGKVRSAMCGQGIGVCLCLTLLIFALPSFSQPSVDTLRCAPPRDVRWADAACGYGSGSGSVASNDSTSGRAADEWRGWTAGGADAGVPHDSLGHRRPKVAVVLSGGGAKGMAHIGQKAVVFGAGCIGAYAERDHTVYGRGIRQRRFPLDLRGQSGGIYKRIDQARTERIKNRQFSPRHSFKKDMVADSEMW